MKHLSLLLIAAVRAEIRTITTLAECNECYGLNDGQNIGFLADGIASVVCRDYDSSVTKCCSEADLNSCRTEAGNHLCQDSLNDGTTSLQLSNRLSCPISQTATCGD